MSLDRCRLGLVIAALSLLPGCQPDPDQRWRAQMQPVPEVSLARRESKDREHLSALRERVERTVASAESNSVQVASAWSELGRQYMAYEYENAALVAFANVLAIDPDWRTAHYLSAVMLQHQGQLSAARAHLLESLRIDPDDGNTLLRLGDLSLAEGDPVTARQYFERAMEVPATRWSAQAGLGRSALMSRDYRGAVGALSTVLEKRPKASALRHPLAQALRELGQVDQAREQLALAGSDPLEQPDPLVDALAELVVGSRALLSRGYAAKAAGDLEGAEQLFRQSAAADPEFDLAHHGLAQVLAEQGRLNDSIAANQVAVRINPAFPEAWFDIGVAQLRLEKPEAAEEAFNRVLAIDGDHLEARFRLAGILHGRGETDAAWSALQQVLAIDPTHVQALQSSVLLAQEAGKLEQAQKQLTRALTLPLDAAGRSTMLALKAHLAGARGDSAAAIAGYEEAAAADPQNFDARFNLGVLQSGAGDLTAAERAFAEALALRPEHSQARLALARTQMGQGQWSAARDTLEAGSLAVRADNEVLMTLIEILAGSPNQAVRDGQRALQLAEQATRQTRNLRFMELTAMAAAELGEFEQATVLVERLLSAAQSKSAPADVRRRLQHALDSYRAQKPLRLEQPH